MLLDNAVRISNKTGGKIALTAIITDMLIPIDSKKKNKCLVINDVKFV
jgi:hypothetical protein